MVIASVLSSERVLLLSKKSVSESNASRWEILEYSEISIFRGEKIEIDTRVWLYPLELVARNYNKRTIKLYLHYNDEFLKFSRKNPHQMSKEERDNLYYLVKRDCSASMLNVAINALKFYYGEILKKKLAYEIIRPKRGKSCPLF